MAYPDDVEIDWEMCDKVAEEKEKPKDWWVSCVAVEEENPLHVDVPESALIPVEVVPPTPALPVQPRARDYMNNTAHANFAPVRTHWFCERYTDPTQAGPVQRVPDYLEYRNLHDLEGSLTTDGYQAPCIDLDFPCKLVETSPGHHHLFMQTKLTLDEYMKLLTVMEEIGLVQRKVLEVARERGQTMVFMPGRKAELIRNGIIPAGANSGGTIGAVTNPPPELFSPPPPRPAP